MGDENQIAPVEKAMYVGANKVIIVADTDRKTPMGNDIVEITFESGKKLKLTKKTYELVVSDVIGDPTTVFRTKLRALVPAIKSVICEYDLAVDEIQALLQALANGIDDNFARATNYLWTGADDGYTPGANPLGPRTLLEADAVIRSIPAPVAEEAKPVADGGTAQ